MSEISLNPVILAAGKTDPAWTRRQRIAALRQRSRQALFISARLSGVALGRLEKDKLGAPLPHHGIHWSLSHKEHYVVGVTAPYPVGIDIEMVKPVKDGLFERIADEDEWALAPARNSLFFFRFWTAKEAVLKAIGKGMTALDHCRVTALIDEVHTHLSVDGSPWAVVHHWVDQRHLAALTTRGEPVCWHDAEVEQVTEFDIFQ